MRAHPYVALLEVETLVLVSHKNPKSNVELPLADQEWLLDILLDDEDVRFDAAHRLYRCVLGLFLSSAGRSHGQSVARLRLLVCLGAWWLNLEGVLGEVLELLRLST